jgi:hypothetical protein
VMLLLYGIRMYGTFIVCLTLLIGRDTITVTISSVPLRRIISNTPLNISNKVEFTINMDLPNINDLILIF